MSGYKGGRDYLDLGTYNLMCAYCGRKRKARELVIDDEFARGLLVCREHRDIRHPQEFARGIKEDMTVPKTQPPIIAFVPATLTFPLTILPPVLVLTLTSLAVFDEAGFFVLDENSQQIMSESGFQGLAIAVLPPWITPTPDDPFGVYVTSILWSWKSGGANIIIDSPTQLSTFFTSTTSGNSGVAQCVVTNNLGGVGTAFVSVSD